MGLTNGIIQRTALANLQLNMRGMLDSQQTAATGKRIRARAGARRRSRCMQFQDITTQQLSYASSVLTETETRLAELASILGPAALGAAGAAAPAAPSGPITFDPAASMANAEARQAVADQIFDRRRR